MSDKLDFDPDDNSDDKPAAFLVTFLIVLPICSVCVLVPLYFGSLLAWAFGWSVDLSPVATAGLIIVTVIIVFVIARWRRRRSRTSEKSEPLEERKTV